MSLEPLLKALSTKGGFETVNKHLTPDRIQIYGRVKGSADRMLMVNFALLQLDAQGDIACDLSRQYILKDGKMVYRWRLIFQSKSIEVKIPTLVRAVNSALTPQTEFDEYPLPGGGSHRAEMKNGKGVQNINGKERLLPHMRR